MMREEEVLAARIAKAETEAEVQGYKMVPHASEFMHWWLAKTVDGHETELGPFDIGQLEDELFGAELLKTEPRGIDASVVDTSTVK